MAYEYITNRNATAYTVGRGGNNIEYIVIHHWGVMGQKFENVVNWFCSPNCPTSAHYVAEEGRVACLVNLSDTAYHAGNWQANQKSIGIECRPEATEGDYKTVAELVANLWKTYGKLPLKRHKDIVPTACPGIWNIEKLTKIAEAIYKGESIEKMQNKNAPSDWAKDSWLKAAAVGLVDGKRPKDAVTREECAVMLLRAIEWIESASKK